MEPSVTSVRFPQARADIISALRALADRDYQEREWGIYRKDKNRYDDLSLNVNLLYDCRALPDPASRVGDALFPSDVEPLLQLGRVLEPLIDELGDRPDRDYMTDQRWTAVVEAAANALAFFDRHGTSHV